MKESALELSRLLRDPDGEYKCDLVIALTHARYASKQEPPLLYLTSLLFFSVPNVRAAPL